MGEPEGTFVDYQTTMVKTAKAIAVTVQEMVGASKPVTVECMPATQSGCYPPCPVQLLSFHQQVTKSTTNPDELGILANQLTHDYGQLAQEAKPAALTAENEEVRALGKHWSVL